MKLVLVFLFAVIVAISADDEKYDTKYDDIDIDAVFSNTRLLKQHHECLMDRGTCTNDVALLKKVLKEALDNGCAKCSDKQKDGARKVIKILYDNHREKYDELKSKYDPEGKYIEKYRDEIRKEGYDV